MKLLRTYICIAALMSALLSAWSQVNTDQVMRIGQNALYFEDYMLSIQYFNQVISAKPHLARPYFFRSVAKLNLDDYQGAEADATMSIDRNPFIADAWEVRGVARQNQGKWEGAVADYTHALTLVPLNRNIMANRAMAQLEMGDTIGATSSYSQLIEAHPGYDAAYVGRARLLLATNDTIGALRDVDKAISISRANPNAYIMRAEIMLRQPDSLATALAAIDQALKLLPRHAGLYVNRAYIRYRMDDYYGAMADFDYAVESDPLNTVAIFNRGLLRAEVRDNDKALRDFSEVLRLNPHDQRALYNRMLLYRETGQYRKALADIDLLLKSQQDMPGLYYMRAELVYRLGNKDAALRDNDKAMAMARRLHTDLGELKDVEVKESMVEETSRKFSQLLTMNQSQAVMDQEYNNPDIRGKVQDRDVTIEILPMYGLTYFSSPTELRQSTPYLKSVDELNATRVLPNVVMLTNDDVVLQSQADIDRQLEAIATFTRAIDSAAKPRAIDHFGRAMSHSTLRDYQAAIDDLTRAIELTPDFALGWLQRGVLRYVSAMSMARLQSASTVAGGDSALLGSAAGSRTLIEEAIADFDRAAQLDASLAYAYYNKGVALAHMQDYASALDAFSRAIATLPALGDAYYNRGYAYLKLGNRDAGIADLSRAGELGVVPSYNLLKRIR